MRCSWGTGVLLLALCAASCEDTSTVADVSIDSTGLERESAFLAELERSAKPRDVDSVVHDPKFVTAAGAQRMNPSERVLGIDLGNVQVAYPIAYLDVVETVEHTVREVDLLVVWCPQCGTGAAYRRSAGGRVPSFGHAGRQWHHSAILYDRATESLWQRETGIAMSGPLRGSRLPRVDGTEIATFAEWRKKHPETLVLEKPAASTLR